jgi:CheY-like chemotaxis protein
MDNLRLLIVDDVEDNRMLLQAICRKMEGFEIEEASDGIEAVEIAEQWRPHIILIDVMMPRMDGFQASKIIKERYPQTIIVALTAVIDPNMEKNMASIGVAAYIHKPVDKELIRFKLQNFAMLLRSRDGEFKHVSLKEALNPFSLDIRHFKTIFTISNAEAMMDFGLWILARCEGSGKMICPKIDMAVELLYELMRQGIRNQESLVIVIEESFEEIFITMTFENAIEQKPKFVTLLAELSDQCSVSEKGASLRLRTHEKTKTLVVKTLEPMIQKESVTSPPPPPPQAEAPKPTASVPVPPKEVKVLETNEKEMLRQSFVRKTSAIEYVQDIGGDVLDEIRDLESLDEEWIEKLQSLETEPTVENIRQFTDNVLGVYVRAINNLFEFTALAYALSSLGSFLKEHADAIITDPKKIKTLVMLTEHLGSDLTSWRDHIFGLQDTADIHYLDSSFFSSCMQIEQIIGNKEVASNDDDDDGMEFF